MAHRHRQLRGVSWEGEREKKQRQLISQLSQFLVVAIFIVIVLLLLLFLLLFLSCHHHRSFALFPHDSKECKFNANGKLLDELSRLSPSPTYSDVNQHCALPWKQATHSFRQLPSLATYTSFGANKMCQKWHD